MSSGSILNMMTEKRVNSKLKGVPGGVSTDGLSLLAKLISRYHIKQLKDQNAVHSSVPSGQSGGQPGGQVDGHTKKEVTYDTTHPDTDPAI